MNNEVSTVVMKKMYRFKRRIGIAVLSAAAAIAATFAACSVHAQSGSAPSATPGRPSIILIVADDVGYGDLGCYGQRQIHTPNIDQLAADGMRFTSCYGGSAVCEPSHEAVLTGKHSGHLSIRDESILPQSLSDGELTIAQYLHMAGYRTGFIGEWELGAQGSPGLPGYHGFDESFGFLTPLEAHNYYPATLYRRDRTGDERLVTVMENQGRQGKYADDFFTEAAMNFVKSEHPQQWNHQKQFFLYLPYSVAHANTELGQITGNGMQVPNDTPYSDQSWPQPEKNRAAMITRLDNYVGHLMDELKKYKVAGQTVVIFTSDNGPAKEGGVDPAFFNSAGNLRGIKRDLHEGGIRVPFIVRWPDAVKAGSTSDLPCALWDFLPTAMEIARLNPPDNIDGISLLPTLNGQTQTNRHEFLYWEMHNGGFRQAVRTANWKALRYGVDGPLELYDLTTDPTESTNVAAQHTDVTARIAEYLKTARTADDRWPAKTAMENAKLSATAAK
jgi:arylsulfatase A-like enzyme